jgi:hypothetical protein
MALKRLLLTTTAVAVLALHARLAGAADVDAVGNVDLPVTVISIEGGALFDASPANLSFDEDDDKLGGLGSLQPGGWGGQVRLEMGQRLNSDWDFKVGLAAIELQEDTAHAASSPEFTAGSGEANASQSTKLQIFDADIGYQTDGLGTLEVRLFGGVRGLHASVNADWDYEGEAAFVGDDEKLGRFGDEIYAVGPRVGVDLALPLNHSNMSLVGSASGSVLYGNIQSQYHFDDGGNRVETTHWTEIESMWTIEGMAGIAFEIGQTADLTLGYRAMQFNGVVPDRSDVGSNGEFSDGGQSDLLVHGPFARLTVEIP